MPNLETARRMMSVQNNGATTVGHIHKENSDKYMEWTWNDDVQSKTCYIYDYVHDDSPTLKDHITYSDDTTKTKIDAKFIISSYGSIDKDQVAYHLLFKPSQKIDFEEGDELYYYETDYKQKYGSSHFIGQYVDIPDDKGVYYRWLICDYEEANQFVKYVILPCDYRFQWIQIIDGKKYKRQMWGCIRAQNSYTSGIYIDRYFTSLDNVDKFILPMNNITESFGYNDHLGDAQRLIISAKVPHPNVWQVSKLENTKPFGLLKVTIKQVPFNNDTDLVEYDDHGNITGMWADYYSVDQSEPIDESIVPPEPPLYDVTIKIDSSSPTIKVGGSYRTITMSFYDVNGNDISDLYKNTNRIYLLSMWSENGRIPFQYETKSDSENQNLYKIKIIGPKECIGCTLEMTIIIDGMSEHVKYLMSVVG